MTNGPSIAYFISPHGFGHAARAAAVLQSLHQLEPTLDIHIYTRVPRWFFDTSLRFSYIYHECLTDIGLVQHSPLKEDLKATIEQLSNFLPFKPAALQTLARELNQYKCKLAICDISPLGIVAAHLAGLPAVLVENFTWDWIYTGYLDQEPGFRPFINEFKNIFQSVDAHIKTQPVCAPCPAACLITNPVARPPRISKEAIRNQLRIPAGARLVLLSMGGFELEYNFLDQVSTLQDIWFVVPGGANETTVQQNLVLLPHHSNYYHPDLVNASDAVVSKAGYSTIAEAYYAGIPFGYVSREPFRESPVLSAFIQQHMAGFEIDGSTFQSGEWLEKISDWVSLERVDRKVPGGAGQAALFIYETYLRTAR